MIMSKQALDREQMEILIRLGVDVSNATFCWLKIYGENKDMIYFNQDFIYKYEILEPFPAFSLQDLIDLLPEWINEYWLSIGKYGICYSDIRQVEIFSAFVDKELIDAVYMMVLWCIDKGYINLQDDEGEAD